MTQLATPDQLREFRTFLEGFPAKTFKMLPYVNKGINEQGVSCMTAACICGFWDTYRNKSEELATLTLPHYDDIFYIAEKGESFRAHGRSHFSLRNFDICYTDATRKRLMLAVVDNLIAHGEPRWREVIESTPPDAEDAS